MIILCGWRYLDDIKNPTCDYYKNNFIMEALIYNKQNINSPSYLYFFQYPIFQQYKNIFCINKFRVKQASDAVVKRLHKKVVLLFFKPSSYVKLNR